MSEIFVFTDNQHAESAFCRGTAKSPGVVQLMIRLHKILIKGYAFIHIVWVAGRRMINQETDGLSRSDLTSGVMRGRNMLEYIPLAHTALGRQGSLVMQLLNDVIQLDVQLQLLTPEEWFYLPHDNEGAYLWAPPPSIAEVAIVSLAEAPHI
ncbi:hypothetical protein ACA910_018981 [Epithemia clementina (nom. ined.)]